MPTGESVIKPIVLILNFKIGLQSEFLTYKLGINIKMITGLGRIQWC